MLNPQSTTSNDRENEKVEGKLVSSLCKISVLIKVVKWAEVCHYFDAGMLAMEYLLFRDVNTHCRPRCFNVFCYLPILPCNALPMNPIPMIKENHHHSMRTPQHFANGFPHDKTCNFLPTLLPPHAFS